MDIRVCLLQPDIVWENPKENLRIYRNMLMAETRGCDLILLPEMFSTGFSMNAPQLAESPGAKTMIWMKKLAREKNAWVLGSIIICENNQYFNRLVCMSPDGKSTHYDKRHLFTLAAEEKTYTAGKEKIFISVCGWKILPLICYDLRFPVWSRNTDDYDLLIYLANWPKKRRYAWNTLLKARAIENQCYVAAVNRVGTDKHGIEHIGDSCIIDFMGEVLKKRSNEPGIIYAELSKENLQKARLKFTFLNDRDEILINP